MAPPHDDAAVGLADADGLRHRRAVFLVILSSLVLSLNGLIFRHVDEASAWQVIFYRSAALAVAMFCLFVVRHRRRWLPELRRAGRTALLTGPMLGVAGVCFILSLSLTTVANTLFTLSSVPLFAAVLAWLILGETVRPATWAAIGVAMAGIAVMVFDGFGSGTLAGNVLALVTAVLFAGFVVALRRGRNIDMLPAVCVAALVSAAIGGVMADGLAPPLRDILLCLAWGAGLSCFAHGIFTYASRFVPAAELTLLSLFEMVIGPFWVWLVFGETPTGLTLAGGAVVVGAIAGWALSGARRQPPPAGAV